MPVKVLTAAEMREVDRRTVQLGIPNPILMENAGHRVVEFLQRDYAPLREQRIVVLCGKGNNGGDGYVIARQLFTRFRPVTLHTVAVFPEDDSEPRRMLAACGCPVFTEVLPEMQMATLVVDAVLGTGLTGGAHGRALDAIHHINRSFPLAKVLAVDVPSGMNADSGESAGEIARADATVTFTAPKLCHVLAPNCYRVGKWKVGVIGSPPALMDGVALHLSGPEYFRHLLGNREPESNKGTYGHVLVVGGAPGKTGAAEMTGLAALRAGAGLVTVACSAERLAIPELMTEMLPANHAELERLSERRNVIAMGPGLGTAQTATDLVRSAVRSSAQPMVLDADALNVLAGHDWHASGQFRVLTPHPGEMARLCAKTVAEVQADRLAVARQYAAEHGCVLVLKGNRTVIANPEGQAWVNPTGSPAMATGGSGDILTGLIAGLLAQHPQDGLAAVLAAVYLHGLAGELAAEHTGDAGLIATDLIRYLPDAIRRAHALSD